MKFVADKLDQAVQQTTTQATPPIGKAAKRSVLERLERDADLLRRARILWADDHPGNNRAATELLQHFGATLEVALSNEQALALLRSARYDAVVTDVARDKEGPLAGIDLADAVRTSTNQRVIIFTGAFNPATVPELTPDGRLLLVKRVQESVFAITNRIDEVLHYVLDLLERGS